MANSLRSRPAKASYSCHSRSVTWLTAVRLSTLAPRASRKAASISRTLSPRAYISTASCSSSAVRPVNPRAPATRTARYDRRPEARRTRSRSPPCAGGSAGTHCDSRRPAPRRSRSTRAPPPSATSASSAPSTIFRTGSLISSLRASPSAIPWVSSSLSFWLVRSEAGILISTGMPPLAAGANRRSSACMPSKSASPSHFPASIGLHRRDSNRSEVDACDR